MSLLLRRLNIAVDYAEQIKCCEKKTFQFQLDLSGQNFYGSKPIVHPVQAEGSVTNHAGALVLEGTARSVLELCCGRCGKEFSREKAVLLDSLVAQELEDEENDDILLLDGKIGRAHV